MASSVEEIPDGGRGLAWTMEGDSGGSSTFDSILRGFSGTVSVQYLTCWDELENTSWETEIDLEQYSTVVERY